MHILMVHSCYPTPKYPDIVGGAEVIVQILAEGLATTSNCKISIIRGCTPLASPSVEALPAADVYTLPIRRPYWPYDPGRKFLGKKVLWHAAEMYGAIPDGFAQIVSAIKPDVAILHNITGFGPSIVPMLKRMGVKVVQTLHDYYYLCNSHTLMNGATPCGSLCNLCVARSVRSSMVEKYLDAVIGTSQEMLDIHLHHGLFHNVPVKTVIHNCVDVSRATIDRNWPETRFGYLGRITPVKGVDLLMSAFSTVAPSARLIVAGVADDSERNRLTALAKRQVDFLGFVPPEVLFNQIDLLVVPSIWMEPFGRSSIEAQAHGVPCIVSNRGGLPATVDYGLSGWIFDPTEPIKLAQLMATLSKDKKLIKGKITGIPHSMQIFSKEHYLSQHRSVLEKIV